MRKKKNLLPDLSAGSNPMDTVLLSAPSSPSWPWGTQLYSKKQGK